MIDGVATIVEVVDGKDTELLDTYAYKQLSDRSYGLAYYDKEKKRLTPVSRCGTLAGLQAAAFGDFINSSLLYLLDIEEEHDNGNA